jgi:small multidrug resistance pump
VSSWIWLTGAIACEIGATLALRASRGFSHPLPVALLLCGYTASFYCLSRALQRGLALSTAYAVWSAAGTAIIALLGIAVLGESRSPVKLASIVLIVISIVGLRLG